MEVAGVRRNPATDALLAWFKGEFTAANAIIDALCNHLRTISDPEQRPEYDQVFAAIHRRRMNWIPILQTQRYFSIAEVVVALRDAAARATEQKKEVVAENAARTEEMVDEGDERSKQKIEEAVEKGKESREPMDRELAEEEATEGEREGLVTKKEEEEQEKKVTESQMPGRFDKEEEEPENKKGDLPAASNLGVSVSRFSNKLNSLEHIHTFSESGGCNQRPERIKTTKGFTAKEPIDGHMVNVVKGLKMYDKIFIDLELSNLASVANDLRVAGQNRELSGETYISFNKQLKGNRREMIQLGVPIFGKKNEKPVDVEPIPASYQEAIDRLVQWRLIPESRKPNCCIINFFDELLLREPTHIPVASPSNFVIIVSGAGALGRPIFGFKQLSLKFPPEDAYPGFISEPILGELLALYPEIYAPLEGPIPPGKICLRDCNTTMSKFFGECSQPYLRPPHIEQPVSTLSLTCDCKMVFGRILMSDRRGNYKGSLELALDEGSLVVMRGNSASTTHAICPSPSKRTTVTFVKVSTEGSNQGRSMVSSRKPLLARKMTLWQVSRLGEKDLSPCKIGTTGPRRFRAAISAAANIPRWGGVFHLPVMSLAPGWPVLVQRKREPPAGTGVFIPSNAKTSLASKIGALGENQARDNADEVQG